MNKIYLEQIRELKLTGHANPLSVQAASGLVKVGKNFYVIADDELSLGVFSLESNAEEVLIPLISGALPKDQKERKKIKPDWESLLLIADDHSIQRGLLAIPSGSRPNRVQGVFCEFKNLKGLKPYTVDFSEVFEQLAKKITDLNIEGACFQGNILKLFQRGNGLMGKGAVIDLDGKGLLEDILNLGRIRAERIQSIRHYDLGLLNGCRLGFTDVCSLNHEIWFLAVAENGESTYEDGLFQGAVLGCLDATGAIKFQCELSNCPAKPEGLWVEKEADGLHFYFVTDADDKNVNAVLLQYFLKQL
ncbi:MAG: DUF6929 family protein [Pseudobdellovibrionaceae bacterium]